MAKATNDEVLDALHAEIGGHLDEIKAMFKAGAVVTLVVRNPVMKAKGKDVDVVISDDDLGGAIEAIQIAKQKRTAKND